VDALRAGRTLDDHGKPRWRRPRERPAGRCAVSMAVKCTRIALTARPRSAQRTTCMAMASESAARDQGRRTMPRTGARPRDRHGGCRRRGRRWRRLPGGGRDRRSRRRGRRRRPGGRAVGSRPRAGVVRGSGLRPGQRRAAGGRRVKRGRIGHAGETRTNVLRPEITLIGRNPGHGRAAERRSGGTMRFPHLCRRCHNWRKLVVLGAASGDALRYFGQPSQRIDAVQLPGGEKKFRPGEEIDVACRGRSDASSARVRTDFHASIAQEQRQGCPGPRA
jgi:hypothetical protein